MTKLASAVEKDVKVIHDESTKQSKVTDLIESLEKEIRSWGVVNEVYLFIYKQLEDVNNELLVHHDRISSFVANNGLMIKTYLDRFQRTVETAKTPREKEYPTSIEFPACSKCKK